MLIKLEFDTGESLFKEVDRFGIATNEEGDVVVQFGEYVGENAVLIKFIEYIEMDYMPFMDREQLEAKELEIIEKTFAEVEENRTFH